MRVIPRTRHSIALLAGVALVACTTGSLDKLTSRPDGGSGAAAGAGGVAGSSAAAGAGGVAGSGGAAATDGGPDAPCTDADGDGVTTCQGDCDDNDANTYPGAPEICGDGKNNGCTGGPADQGCAGLGTFVSSKVGTASGKGTMSDPVDTIAHGIQNAQAILKSNPTRKTIVVYVADGQYPEKVTLVEGISLFGGYSCEKAACTWQHDPKTFVSVIQDQDDEGLLAPHAITRQTKLDGFHIQGHDTASTPIVPGAAAVTISSGSPTISDNTINGPAVTSNGSGAASIGLAIGALAAMSSPGPLITGNTINGGKAVLGSIGIALTAPRGFNYSSGNPPATVAEIKNNTILGGPGSASAGISATSSGNGTLVASNVIAGGTAGFASWGVSFSSSLVIDSNRIGADAKATPACTNVLAQWCGGIQSASGQGTIINNIVYGANAPLSTAIRLMQSGKQVQEVIVSSNYLVGAPPALANTVPPQAAAIVLANAGCTGCSATAVGNIKNNFIMPGRATQRFGVLEVQSAQDIQPTSIQNNDFWLIPYSTPNDVIYRQTSGNNHTDLVTLTSVNALTYASGNFAADCYDATFHLKSGAQCIDAGVASDAPDHDFEGDKRPQGNGYDVGPDEAP